MPQIKVPKGISPRALFAGRDNSVHVLQDHKHLPRALKPLFPSHGTALGLNSHHCWHSPSLLLDPVMLNQCHTNPSARAVLHTQGSAPQPSEGLEESSPQHLLKHQTQHKAQPSLGSLAQAAAGTGTSGSLAATEQVLLQNQKADV